MRLWSSVPLMSGLNREWHSVSDQEQACKEAAMLCIWLWRRGRMEESEVGC